jgi:hypothetical protein
MRWMAVLLMACGGPNPDAETDPTVADADADGVEDAEDCAPEDATTYPGARDALGDGVDQDCSGADGVDADADGAPAGPDCDDDDAAIGPDAAEVHYDDIDQNCNGDRDDDDQDGDGKRASSEGGPDCDDTNPAVVDEINAIERTVPELGATDVLIGSDLVIALTAPDPNAEVTVVDQDNQPVPGTVVVDNRVVTFTPTGGWPTFSTLTATIQSYCTTETVGFSTSDLGLPVADPAALAGRAYWLDARTGVITQPPLLQGVLAASITFGQVVQISEITPAGFSAFSLTVPDGTTSQDVCLPTVDLVAPGSLAANPIVTFEPDALPFLGFPAPPGGSTFSGVMRSDGSAIVDGIWDIQLDLRTALGNDNLANNFCRIYALAGLPCAPCPDGVTACWVIRFEELEVPAAPYPILRRTPDEIAADPVCATP